VSIARRVATDKVIMCVGLVFVGGIIGAVVVVTVDPASLKGQTTQPPVSAIG